MFPRFTPTFAGLLLLAACGTPQQRCINGATRDLRIVDRLIGQSQQNLRRGYAMEDVVRTGVRWEECRPAVAATATTEAQPARMCLEDYSYTVARPKAINLADEREKLAEMQTKRRELAKDADLAAAQCRLEHPE
tara:strand:+ start:1319 stop:1723 length:405 start_codon:yes stop_codon:yes gene_type:complete